MPLYISSLRSVTHAEKAKRILGRAGIKCAIVGLDRSLTKHGCAYGIEYSAEDAGRVRTFLFENSLAYGDVLGR